MSAVIQEQGNPQSPGSWPGGDGGGGNWPRYPRLYEAIPDSGPTTGGNTVLLTGAGLQGTSQVTFGGIPATIVAQDPSGGSITVIAPPPPQAPSRSSPPHRGATPTR
ncbi:IPT/TIG domain-containing protein [Streptomyces decoyicus]